MKQNEKQRTGWYHRMRMMRAFSWIGIVVYLLGGVLLFLMRGHILFVGVFEVFFFLLLLVSVASRSWKYLCGAGLLVGTHLFIIGSSAVGISGAIGYGVCWVLLGVFFIRYIREEASVLSESSARKERLFAEERLFEQKHAMKEESLSELKQRVDDLFKLFEVARECNESMSYKEIGIMLSERLIYDVPFVRGYLLVFEGKRKKQVGKTFLFSEQKWEELVHVEEHFTVDELLLFLEKQKSATTIHQSTSSALPLFLRTTSAVYPVWIFPLFVQEKLVACILIEGGREQDFNKFAIIAAQLAMQIKKITLYNTVRELSITDGLTGVYVRRHFLERFDEELKRSVKNHYALCVMMLDIDFFKKYNDTFGHLVGDVTLKEVSRIIQENVRKVDLIARYGGEEFAIILPETNKKGGLEAAERIRAAVSQKVFRVYDEETKVTVSIGLAVFPDDCTRIEPDYSSELALELIQKADQALYQAKEKGRNQVIAY